MSILLKQIIRSLRSSPLLWPVLALAALLLFNAFATSGFFEVTLSDGRLYGSLIDIALRAAPLILVALGMTLVIATGGVDLSVGAVAALAPAMAVVGLAQGWGFAGALGFALSVAILVGLWNGILITSLGLQPIIATLIAMVAGRGIAQLPLDGQIVPFESAGFAFLGAGHFLGLPVAVLVAFVGLLVMALLCRKTAAGLFIEALGSSATASRFTGLHVGSVRLFAYIACGLLAGAAGLLMSSNIRAVDVNNLGLFLELDAILAVVIGGTRLSGGRFTLMGSVLGALIIQTVTTTINTQGVAVESMLVVKALIVIAICLLQSEQFRNMLSLIKDQFTPLNPNSSGGPVASEPMGASQEKAVT